MSRVRRGRNFAQAELVSRQLVLSRGFYMRLRSFWVAVLALACLGLLPGVARAQSAISGVVKDASGGVMPGVTVEAASPALIEKVRSWYPMIVAYT
jgi:hypothetical protein